MASPVETQQAFLEGHAHAFDWFDGVFEEVRYDNLGSAVKKVLKGRRRIESDRFVSMRSHYLYESIFTTVGITGAHEKAQCSGPRHEPQGSRNRSADKQRNRQILNGATSCDAVPGSGLEEQRNGKSR